MNRGSTCREKPQHQTAFRAYSGRRAPGANSRGDRVQEPSAGTAAKDTGKLKLLQKKSSKDPNVLSPFRTKIHEEKTNGQKVLPNIRVPEKGKAPPKDLNQTTKRSDRSVSFAATPKVEARGKTSKNETGAKKNPDGKEKEPQINNSTEEKLRGKITSAIINYIKSTPFKRQLSEHIVWEISVKIAKAVSQYHEQQQTKRVCKTKAQRKNTARGGPQERSSKLGFSISVASLLGYELIESRDKMIEYFKNKSAELSMSNNTETEIVKNVFESILAFVINVETLHPVEDIDTYSPDHVVDSFESILQNINSADGESLFHDPTLKADESSTSSTESTPVDKSDAKPPLAKKVVPSKVDALKVEDLGHQEQQESHERISGPRKFMEKLKSFLTPATSDQDQSSEVDDKEKDDAEDEKIQAAVSPATQTTAIEQDLKPDEEAEEHLVADAGVDLDQAVTPEEKILSEVDEQDLQPSEHQELASPVPSPLASEKPDTPRESPKRTTCLPEQTSYSPDLPVSIPKTSDTETTAISQKEEEDLQHTLRLSDLENTVSLESEEKEEEIEMPAPDQEAEELLVDEPDVDLDQVLATPSEENILCEVTEQDLQLTGHRDHASPVPSLPSTEESASPRTSATRSARPTKRASSLYSGKKVMKKGSVSVTTSSRLKESQILSKTFNIKKSTVRKAPLTGFRKEHRPATAGDATNQSLKALKTEPVDSDSNTMALPTKSKVPEVKPSECDSTIHKKKTAPVNRKRIDFSKCCTSCTCNHQDQDH